MTDREGFRERMAQELLDRYPAWREPAALWHPGTPRPRRRGRWLLAATALAVLLAAVPLALKNHQASAPASRARLMAWPPGFTIGAHISLNAGRLLLFQGRRVRVYVAGQLGHQMWAAILPGGESALAGAAGWRGETALVMLRGLGAALQVRDGRGALIANVRLGSGASDVGPWTVRAAGGQGWVVSDRDTTWLVRLDGRVVGPLAGGSGSLAVAQAPGVTWVVAWAPTQRTLYVYSMTGRRQYRVPQPALGLGIGNAPGFLVPTGGGVGFAIGSPRGYGVPYFIGGVVEPQGFMPAGVATPAGVLVNSGGTAGLVVWHGPLFTPLPLGSPLPALFFSSSLAPRAFLTVPSVLVGTEGARLVAVSAFGDTLAAMRVGRVGALDAGARFVYAATPKGLVQLGSFAPVAAVSHALSWRGEAGGWSASVTVTPLSGWPATKPRIPPVSVPDGVMLLAIQGDEMFRATVRLHHVGGGVVPPGTSVSGQVTVGERTWGINGPVRDGTATVATTITLPLVTWVGAQDGWLLEATVLGARISYAVQGHRHTIVLAPADPTGAHG